MTQISSRYLYNIYCDDIRQEVGNKKTFVGVYNDTLLSINKDYVFLPKLCIVATFGTAKSDPLKTLKFTIRFNNKVIHEMSHSDMSLVKEESEADLLIYGALISISPFSIKEEGILNVIAETDREEVAGNALKIVFVKSEENTES